MNSKVAVIFILLVTPGMSSVHGAAQKGGAQKDVAKQISVTVRTVEAINLQVVGLSDEFQIAKAVSWTVPAGNSNDAPVVEFAGAEPRVFSVDLFFDSYDTRESVHSKYIESLEKMTMVVEASKRPPVCVVVWGSNFLPFRGVIESLTVRYTMFLDDGTPVRATASVKIKSAGGAQVR